MNWQTVLKNCLLTFVHISCGLTFLTQKEKLLPNLLKDIHNESLDA
jgi:hypothetical protein